VAPLVRDGSFVGAVHLSGEHAESVDEIVWAKADGTAIDCVSYELFRRVRPAAICGNARRGTHAVRARAAVCDWD